MMRALILISVLNATGCTFVGTGVGAGIGVIQGHTARDAAYGALTGLIADIRFWRDLKRQFRRR
jgi:hypothetical protein